MLTEKARRSVVCVLDLIRNRNTGEYLLSQRNQPEIPDVHLKWDFVGGANEFGEPVEETLAREALEESGLEVRVFSLFPRVITHTWESDKELVHCVVMCFECIMIGGKLRSNDPKIKELRWVSKENLKNYELMATTKVFVDMLLDRPPW